MNRPSPAPPPAVGAHASIERRQFPGLDLWPLGLSNADAGYLPTREMIDEGGYEGRSTIFSAEAEEVVQRDACGLVDQLRGG